MALHYNSSDLLCSSNFVWTYSAFERYLGESITPSMYRYMAKFVYEKMGCKNSEEDAVNSYFEIPINTRIEMHEAELALLRSSISTATAKADNATDFLRKEGPFDPTCPISTELKDFMIGSATKYNDEVARLENLLHEENFWRGGHEYGAEFNL
jgi:hypothetical protein